MVSRPGTRSLSSSTTRRVMRRTPSSCSRREFPLLRRTTPLDPRTRPKAWCSSPWGSGSRPAPSSRPQSTGTGFRSTCGRLPTPWTFAGCPAAITQSHGAWAETARTSWSSTSSSTRCARCRTGPGAHRRPRLDPAPDGTAYLLSYEPDPATGLTDAIIQHLSSRGEVLFEWNSADHVDIDAETVSMPATPTTHTSTRSRVMDDGDLLVSFRHLSSVFKIARRRTTASTSETWCGASAAAPATSPSSTLPGSGRRAVCPAHGDPARQRRHHGLRQRRLEPQAAVHRSGQPVGAAGPADSHAHRPVVPRRDDDDGHHGERLHGGQRER